MRTQCGANLLLQIFPAGVKAQTVHAGIDLQMALDMDSQSRGRFLQRLSIFHGKQRLGQIIFIQSNGISHRSITQNQNGTGDTSLSQRHPFLDGSHTKPIRSQPLQFPGHRNISMAIGVCLDHRHIQTALPAEGAIIISKGVQIHLCPDPSLQLQVVSSFSRVR